MQTSVNVLEKLGSLYSEPWICGRKYRKLEKHLLRSISEHMILVHDGRADALLVSSSDYVFAWLPLTFYQMCLYQFRIMDLRFDRKHQQQHDETLRGIQPVKDPTAEPPPSKKHYKIAVLSIAGLQMISRDTPFLRYQLISNLYF